MSGSSFSNLFMRRYMPFAVAAGAGTVATAVAMLASVEISYLIGANAFFLAYTGAVIGVEIPKLTGAFLRKHARSADAPVFIIFAVTLAVVTVATLSLFQVINSGSSHPVELVFALLSIPLGWLTIHTMASIHYAHLYWMDDDLRAGGSTNATESVGGLNFPGEDSHEPEGWDFLYFAAVIGMTAQTADTDITTTAMRKVVLVHSIVAFFYNTIIVAAAVNLAVSLGSK